MNIDIEKGGRRLVLVVSWVAAVIVFFACAIAEINVGGAHLGISAIIGGFAGMICNIIGRWVLDGFIGDQEKKD